MRRSKLACLALVVALGISATQAVAKTVCLKMDLLGSDYTIVVTGIGKSAKAVGGYVADYQVTGYEYRPVAGSGFLSSAQVLVLGLTDYSVGLSSVGLSGYSSNTTHVVVSCRPGADGKLGPADSCSGVWGTGFIAGQVVPCTPDNAPPLP